MSIADEDPWSLGMLMYLRIIKVLVEQGMNEHKAITLVANSYGIDWHVLEVVYHHRNELTGGKQ